MDLVSVITPYYKKKNFIKEAILSVLNQTYQNLEIFIIYDDECTDDLDYIKEIKSLDKRINLIINTKKLGVGLSRNLAIKSARKVLKSINPRHIDHLIYCTQTPDYIIPTNACIIQNKLNLKKNIGAFDINLGCSGYIYLLSIAKSLIVSGQAKNILLITADTYSKFINKKDLSTRLIFSDSSTSTIISSKKKSNSFKIINFAYGTDGAGHKNFILDNFGTKNWANPK